MDMVKKRPLEEMIVRVNNLKKKFGADYVDQVLAYFRVQAEFELDVYYLTYYHIRRCKLRYCPNAYGEFTNIDYQRRTVNFYYSAYSSYPYYYYNNGNFPHGFTI